MFPSYSDRDYLRGKVRSLLPLTEDEKQRWHAYDYGFRAVFLSDRTRRSPIDEGGAFYDQTMAAEAERLFQQRRR